MADGPPTAKPHKALYVSWCPKDAIDGMVQLDVYEELAYRRIIDFIYTTGDRLEDDDRKLGNMTKLGTARWKKVKDALVNKYGKLRIIDGRITNPRCQDELVRVAERISQKVRAGKASAKVRLGVSENSVPSTDNPLINNETPSTDVTHHVEARVGTKQELRVEEDNSAREDTPIDYPPTPHNRDPDEWAMIRSMTAALVSAYGKEIGEYERHFTPSTDWVDAAALLKTGADVGLSPPEIIEVVREHLFMKCRNFANDGEKPPRAISWFASSAGKALKNMAKRKARAAAGYAPEGFDPRHQGARKPYGNGGDAPTTNTVEQPWQRIQKRLLSAGQVGAARELSAASAHGPAAANQLAAELEGRHLPKRHPAAQAA